MGPQDFEDTGTFAAKVYELRAAGTYWFPEAAEQLASAVLDLYGVLGRIGSVAGAAGNPMALHDLLKIRTELHTHALVAMRSMAATGEVLTGIADDYLATDDKVRHDYEVIRRSHAFDDRTSNDGSSLPRPDDPPPTPRGGMDYE